MVAHQTPRCFVTAKLAEIKTAGMSFLSQWSAYALLYRRFRGDISLVE
jgi:hypothetical protein